jgi:hypothetical protein
MEVTKQNTSSEATACGLGIEISDNNFTSILGSCQVDTGLIRVQCNDTAFAELVKTDDEDRDYTYIN